MGDKVTLNFLGGCGEIGGNKILLTDSKYKVKIFLDFGCCFGNLKNRDKRIRFPERFDDVFESGALPREEEVDVKNLYSTHYIFDHNSEKYRQKNLFVKGMRDPPTDIDGVLISHAHRDHYFGIPFLNRNIPIYTGVVTARIIKSKYDSTKPRMENYYRGLQFKKFRTGDAFQIKGLKVEPIHVDHSVPASYGFILYTSIGPIVYTGDFRMHGPLAHMTQDLIDRTREICESNNQRVKALICEGTQIEKGHMESEESMKKQLENLMSSGGYNFLFVKYNLNDWDHFRTFVRAAEKFNWKFVISEKDAYFYHQLNKKAIYKTMRDPSIRHDNTVIIIKEGPAKYPWQVIIRQMLDKMKDRTITREELKNLKENFCLRVNYFEESILDHIKPNLKGAFVSSSAEKDDEAARWKEKSLLRKLTSCGLPFYRIDASGHAMPHHIWNVIEEINPEIVFPVHTKHPEMFAKFLEKKDFSVIIPEYNKPVQIE